MTVPLRPIELISDLLRTISSSPGAGVCSNVMKHDDRGLMFIGNCEKLEHGKMQIEVFKTNWPHEFVPWRLVAFLFNSAY
jgi:hypothetical protein